MPARRNALVKGLQRVGLKPVDGLPVNPVEGDVFITWNRIGSANNWARMFERNGWPVLVVENATWGNDFVGDRWYHIARTYHNTAGCYPVGGPERWDSLEVPLAPFRCTGDTVILLQRGIGSPPTKMPAKFVAKVIKHHKGARIRRHPGKREVNPLQNELRNTARVVTWGSGAAVWALQRGVHVTSYMPNWIGEQDNTVEGRLQMFRRLAWAQWTLHEIEQGQPFHRLLAQ